jgi:hypothetical protein
MKKTKFQAAPKLTLNKSQIASLTAKQAEQVAGGARIVILVTHNIICDLASNNTHIESVCACTRP